MPAPLELTDQQKRDFLKQKTDLFLSELKKIEESTGMTLQADLAFTPSGIFPRVRIIPVDEKDQTTTKSN